MRTAIYNYLKAASTPVKRKELLAAMRIRMDDSYLSDRALRKCVEDMIKEDGYMIQSSDKGYNLIETEEQLIEAMKYMSAKAEAISVRKNYLVHNFRLKFGREPVCQPLLFG